MVIQGSNPLHRRRGALIAELIIALAIIAIAVIPLAFSFNHEQKVLTGYYHRALAVEIIDGELEVLAAGEWRTFKPGSQSYEVETASAKNLPKGHFTLTIEEKLIRLEWTPEQRGKGGKVSREVRRP